VPKCFNDGGHYRRTNINMPRSLPLRSDGHQSFALDTPLTEMGYLQAKITGERRRSYPTHHEYNSRSGTARGRLHARGHVRLPGAAMRADGRRDTQGTAGLLSQLKSTTLISQGMSNANLQLNIEPALFEWAAWFKASLPSWMSPAELCGEWYRTASSFDRSF